MSQDYGPLAETVALAGALMSATSALVLTWKGRARWEPAEEDLPKGSQRVAGLCIAVGIAAIWYWYRNPESADILTTIAISCAAICTVFVVTYSLFVSIFLYDQQYSAQANKTLVRKVIGGYWFTDAAKEVKAEGKLTTQEIFAGAAYDPDKVWPRLSRALAKVTFVALYVVIVSAGTTALTCGSFLLSLNV